MKKYTVLDIGGTFIKTAVMLENGDVISEYKIPTPDQGTGEIFDVIRNIVLKDLEKDPTISGAALSIPAAVDVKSGYVSYAGSVTDFIGKYVKAELADLNIPIEVENDANCAALAEKWQGNAMDVDTFLCVTIGTGIGGAIYLKNGIFHGVEGMAGEFGLMLLNHDAPWNDLFATETFSRLSSTWNLVNYLNKHFHKDYRGEEWFQLYDDGDIQVSQIIKQYYKRLAVGIVNLMHIIAPEKILIGGGISERKDLITSIQDHIDQVDTPIAGKVTVEACTFKNQAGLKGALYHFLKMKNKLN